MSKLPQKNQAPRIEPKAQKKTLKDHDTSFDETDIDHYFRFDDRLIGKRTNTVFEAKPTPDGFFDIVHDSLESSEEEISSSPFEGFDISDVQNKNQKMMRYLAQELDEDQNLAEISEDEDLTEDNESKSKARKLEKQLEKPQKKLQKNQEVQKSQKIQKKPEKAEKVQKKHEKVEKKPERSIEKKIDQIIEKSILRSKRAGLSSENNEKSDEELVKPTSKKKSYAHSPSKYDYEDPDMQKIEEAKSKARSEENPKQANQKVETNNEEIVKVEKKFQNKNQIKEKRREEKEKQIKKQINELMAGEKQKDDQKEKKDLTSVENKDLNKKQKTKTVTERVVQASKIRKLNNIKKSKKERPSIPKRREFQNKKRVPSTLKEEEDEIIPKFKVIVDVQRPGENEEYEPFGRMGEGGRYPKRLRVPPLRFWHNERRNYERGMLSSITLIDDKRGRKFGALIDSQL